MSDQLHTPVLLVGYNRPELMRRVVESLAVARPAKVFLAVDGPKKNRPDDPALCDAVERVVRDGVNWPCDLKVLRQAENQGCGRAVAAALTWLFSEAEEGIVIEDDVVPHPDFFTFCASLLERYRDDARVWSITGANFQDDAVRGDAGYYFSKYCGSWGWASWRRCWTHYDPALPDFDSLEDAAWWNELHPDPAEALYWRRQFREVQSGRVDTWDYQWQWQCWKHGALVATSNVNLTSNIGFGGAATHTMDADHFWSERKTAALGALGHPSNVKQDAAADAHMFTQHFCPARSEAERLVWGALIKQQSRQIKHLDDALAESEKRTRELGKELTWAAAHRWKAARRLLAGRWPEARE